MIVCEGALAGIGIYYLATGRLRLLGRALEGARARLVGLILLGPLVLMVALTLAVSAGTTPEEGISDDAANALTLAELVVLATALGAAGYLIFVRGTPTMMWAAPPQRGTELPPPAPRADRMTLSDAARALSMQEDAVVGLIQSGTLPGVRVGGTYHVDRAAVVAYRRRTDAPL